MDAALVGLRHLLLWLLPTADEPGDSWHAVACAVGDLLEDVFGLVAIALIMGMVAVTALILWWVSPWLLVSAVLAGVLGVGVWRQRVAVRRLECMVDEEAPR